MVQLNEQLIKQLIKQMIEQLIGGGFGGGLTLPALPRHNIHNARQLPRAMIIVMEFQLYIEHIATTVSYATKV